MFLTLWPVLALAQTGDLTPKPSATPTPVPHVKQAWYIRITPNPPNGPSFLIGPWWDYAVAADLDGSMLYGHPFACHNTGPHPPSNCRIMGNGMAYPANWAWVSNGATVRVPPVHQIPSSGPILLPVAGNPSLRGWYGLYYGNDGTGLAYPRSQRAVYAAKVKVGQGLFPRYSDMACPMAPYFLIGSRLGQQDYACE